MFYDMAGCRGAPGDRGGAGIVDRGTVEQLTPSLARDPPDNVTLNRDFRPYRPGTVIHMVLPR